MIAIYVKVNLSTPVPPRPEPDQPTPIPTPPFPPKQPFPGQPEEPVAIGGFQCTNGHCR